ncbi:hypothetical protein JEQ21_06280 [Streptococcus sp. 121]|uniref:hypothetical protein n=1 Tax=Streptococcus sp. 121 TaxID=2797637 RepID=UPI0018F10679|nr:hypothetical protein [Streptococcus sp. 121]MBJ6746064.1 hypothetical protein [Streptococcus sp. 121]
MTTFLGTRETPVTVLVKNNQTVVFEEGSSGKITGVVLAIPISFKSEVKMDLADQ